MNKETRAAVTPLVQELKPIVHDKVKAIEARPATTQDHYGDYLALLLSLGIDSNSSNNRCLALITGRALIECGASENGVCAAVRAGLGMPDMAEEIANLGPVPAGGAS